MANATLELARGRLEQKMGGAAATAPIVNILTQINVEKGARATLEYAAKPFSESGIPSERQQIAIEQNIGEGRPVLPGTSEFLNRADANRAINLQNKYLREGYAGLTGVEKSSMRDWAKQAINSNPHAKALYDARVATGTGDQFIDELLENSTTATEMSKFLQDRVKPDAVSSQIATKQQEKQTALDAVETETQTLKTQLAQEEAKLRRLDTGTPAAAGRPAISGELTRLSQQITQLEQKVNDIDADLHPPGGAPPGAAVAAELRRQREMIVAQETALEDQFLVRREERDNADVKRAELRAKLDLLDNADPANLGRKQTLQNELATIRTTRNIYETGWVRSVQAVVRDATAVTITESMKTGEETWSQKKTEIQNEQLRAVVENIDVALTTPGTGPAAVKAMLDRIQNTGIRHVFPLTPGGAISPEQQAILDNPELLTQFETKMIPRLLSLRLQEGKLSKEEFLKFARSPHVGREKVVNAITEDHNARTALQQAMEQGGVKGDLKDWFMKQPNKKFWLLALIALGVMAFGPMSSVGLLGTLAKR